MNIHDSGYKKLFSNRTIFRQQCRLISRMWMIIIRRQKAILSTALVLRERSVYIYVLIEFQSTVDKFMAMRVLHYVSNI